MNLTLIQEDYLQVSNLYFEYGIILILKEDLYINNIIDSFIYLAFNLFVCRSSTFKYLKNPNMLF